MEYYYDHERDKLYYDHICIDYDHMYYIVKNNYDKEEFELYDLMYQSNYLYDYYYTSGVRVHASTVIANIITDELEKRMEKNQEEFDESEAIYAGIVYNECDDCHKFFYEESVYSGKHHRIMLKFCDFKNSSTQTQLVGPDIIIDNNKVTYEENGDITLNINCQFFIYCPVSLDFQKIRETIKNELNHITQIYFNYEIVLATNTTKKNIYVEYIKFREFFWNCYNYNYINDIMYLFSFDEMDENLKQTEIVIRSYSLDENFKNEIFEKKFIDYFKTTRHKGIDKYTLVDFVYQLPYIKNASKLSIMFNRMKQFHHYIGYVEKQKILLFIGYFLDRCNLLKIDLNEEKDECYINCVKFLKPDMLKQFLKSNINEYETNTQYSKLIDFIYKNLIRLYIDYQQKIYNMIVSYLPKLFNHEDIKEPEILINTIFKNDFKLTDDEISSLDFCVSNRQIAEVSVHGHPMSPGDDIDYDFYSYFIEELESFFNKKERF